MTPDRWKQKIGAYLAWPPDRALAPSGAEGRAVALVEAALDEGEEVELPHEAARQAAGLDAPLGTNGSDAASVFARHPQVVHPLSGAVNPLKIDGDLDADTVFAAVKEAVSNLSDDAPRADDSNGPDPEKLFFMLWRYLPEEVKKSDALPEGAWDLLPADPRFPSLSTWHHASAASALAGAGETPALLLFTLGSPQAFVTTSRRTQDYWMGSFLISYLMWQGMQTLAARCGPDAFLYPNLHGQPLVDKWLASEEVGSFDMRKNQDALQIANFPNVFTALVPNGEAEEIAEDVEQSIRDAWVVIGRNVKREVERSASEVLGLELAGTDAVWSSDWDRQLGDFPDRLGVFWSVCPWGAPGDVLKKAFPEDETGQPGIVSHVRALLEWVEEESETPNPGMGYALLSNLAGGALTSRKALRDFPNVKEPGWKCSLCGERRALHPEWETAKERYDTRREEVRLRSFWNDLASIQPDAGEDIQKLAGRIRPGDRLCAVCLTKRLALEACFEDEFGFEHLLFPSTATLATAPFKAALLEALRADDAQAQAIAHYAEVTTRFLKKAGAFYYSAAVPELENVAESVAHDAAKTLLRLDGEWLYEEAFDPGKLRREYEADVEGQPELEQLRLDALDALRTMLDETTALGRPSRYYAILSMDGDKMGDRISGKSAPFYEWMLHPEADPKNLNVPSLNADGHEELKRPLGPGTHLALSGVLKDFALRLARFAVEEVHRGKLIFAGGDDAVALLPVEDLLPTMKLLRTFFQGGDVAEPLSAGGFTVHTGGGFGAITREDLSNGEAGGTTQRFLLGGAPHERKRRGVAGLDSAQGPTASIGVAIVHESAPLVPSIEEAVSKAMKESAKERAGRDAFAIHLLKRSGGPLRTAAPFFPGGSSSRATHDVLARLTEVVDHLREGRFSARSLASDLSKKPLGKQKTTQRDWLREARHAELNRLTRRRTRDPGDEGPIETLDTLLHALHVAEEQYLKDEPSGDASPDDAWTTLARLIRVAHFLAIETAHAA